MKPYFWGKTSLLLTHKPLTDNVIKAAEQHLSVQLPAAYLAVLREQNGGYINYRGLPAPQVESMWGDVLPVDFIWGIGHDNGILDSPTITQLHGLPESLIIFAGDDGFWLAMDYRDCEDYCDPPIVYIDVEADNHIMPLAPNFARFLDDLVLGEPEYILGIIAPKQPLAVMMSQINECWQIRLAPIKRPQASRQSAIYYHPAWYGDWYDERARILLYANKAPNGDKHFPMFPDCDWLLSCDIADAIIMLMLEAQLANCLPYEIIRINTPYVQETAEI